MVVEVRQLQRYVRHTDATAPGDTPPSGRILGPNFVGAGAEMRWTDEDGRVWSDQPTVVGFNASKTLVLSDRKTLQNYTGTTAATLTIPTDAVANFSIGTTIQIMRGASAGALTLAAASGVTLTAPNGFLGNTLYPTEIVEIQKVGANAWLGRIVNDRQIRIIQYAYLTKSTWTASGLVAATSIPITTAVQSGRISVGLQTEHSGGVFALAGTAGSTVTAKDPHGYYANAVELRRLSSDLTAPGFPISFNDNGTRRLVFGLLHTSAADGATITASNLFISFVYESGAGVLTSTTITGSIEFELLFAVAGDDIPFEI